MSSCFLTVLSGAAASIAAAATPSPPPSPGFHKVCGRALENQCKFGAKCAHWHPDPADLEQVAAARARSGTCNLCKFDLGKGCANAERCPNLHLGAVQHRPRWAPKAAIAEGAPAAPKPASVPAERSPAHPPSPGFHKVCGRALENQCKFGAKCAHWHPDPADLERVAAARARSGTCNLCKFDLGKGCANAERCPNLHLGAVQHKPRWAPKAAASASAASSATTASPPPSDVERLELDCQELERLALL